MLNTVDLVDSLTDSENAPEISALLGVEVIEGSLSEVPEIELYGFNRHKLTKLPEMVHVYLSEDIHSLVITVPVNFMSYRVIVVNALHSAGLHPDQVDNVVDHYTAIYQHDSKYRKLASE